MATASDVIRRGYRRANLIGIAASPTAAETTEALEFLNGLILSCVGNEAGVELTDLTIGGEFDQSPTSYVPENARLIVAQAGSTLKLHPRPYEGQRVAVADAGSLATNPLTLDGNGRLIEETSTVTLNTDGLSRQWMYRSDTANWVRITELVAADEMPFPTEFDDYFVTGLALQLAPANSAALPAEVLNRYEVAQTKIRARYRRRRPSGDPGILGLLGSRQSI